MHLPVRLLKPGNTPRILGLARSSRATSVLPPYSHAALTHYNWYSTATSNTANANSGNANGQQSSNTNKTPEKQEKQKAEPQEKNGKDQTVVQEEIQKLKTTLQDKDKQIAELKDAYLRSAADQANLRTRHEKELSQAKDYAIQKFAKELLETADVLSMAMKAVPENDKQVKAVKDLLVGVEMTRKNLLGTFNKFHINMFSPLHETFDPNTMQAMFRVPKSAAIGKNKDGKDMQLESGTVSAVMKEGYMIKDRVLRAAQVGVVADE